MMSLELKSSAVYQPDLNLRPMGQVTLVLTATSHQHISSASKHSLYPPAGKSSEVLPKRDLSTLVSSQAHCLCLARSCSSTPWHQQPPQSSNSPSPTQFSLSLWATLLQPL